jgi:CubicO group peptidase (beta-lactamase class C family)
VAEQQNGLIRDQVFNQMIELIMKNSHFPSVSACIIKDDQVVWSKGYGLRDMENDLTADENTIYMVASISKTITGTALMQLYEQGLFDLDDDVNEYLPFILRNPHFPDKNITVRMLLSHSSSLNNDPEIYYWYWDLFLPGNFSSWYPEPWLEEYLTPGGEFYVTNIWNENNYPGNRSVYANINFDLVAYLVEIISGQSFTEYCNEHIFKPLEMWNTSFTFTEINENQIAIPYIWNEAEKRHYVDTSFDDQWANPDFYFPVGGLLTTISDLSHFMIAHMNGGVYNGIRILNETTIEEMHSIQPPGNKYAFYYGLAWLISPRTFIIGSELTFFPRMIYAGHGGDLASYHTRMYRRQNMDVAMIFFINTGRNHKSGWNGAGLLTEFLFLKGICS